MPDFPALPLAPAFLGTLGSCCRSSTVVILPVPCPAALTVLWVALQWLLSWTFEHSLLSRLLTLLLFLALLVGRLRGLTVGSEFGEFRTRISPCPFSFKPSCISPTLCLSSSDEGLLSTLMIFEQLILLLGIMLVGMDEAAIGMLEITLM